MKIWNMNSFSRHKTRILALLIAVMLPLLFACAKDGQDNGGNNAHTHAYTEKLPWLEESVITDRTCVQEGEYYYVCTCGAVGTETYTVGVTPHQFYERIEDDAHLASDATCIDPKRYYYECSECSAISDELTFFSGHRAEHKYVDNTCVYGCGDELNKYTLSENEEYYTLTNYRENTSVVTVPQKYKGLPVKAIGEHAFGSVDVKEVILPSSVDTIHGHAFYDHKTLEKINLESVAYIGEHAFYNCEMLAEADLVNAVTLGKYCFSGAGLSEVTIPEGVIEIGTNAFSFCGKLTKINYLAVNCADLENLESIVKNQDAGAPYICLYIGNKVEKIPDNMFSYSKLSKIEFAPDGVCHTIGQRAFNSFSGEMPLELTTVESIGEYAFANSGLTELTLGGKINVVGNSAFSHCERLTKVVLAANGGGFGDHLFASGADSVDIYYLHNGDEPLRRALWSCNADLIIGKDVKTIPANFEEGGVVTLRFEDGASDVSIGEKAFISSVSGVLDLSPVTSIGSRAFYRTGIEAPLTRVIIGEDLESIGAYAFGEVQEVLFLAEYCADVINSDAAIPSAESITIGKNVRRIPGSLLYGANVKSISFESGSICEEIGEKAFYNAKIPGFSLPSSVKTIGAYAFENASGVTEKLDLNGVTTFGAYAFRDYEGEIDISNSSAASIARYAFNGANVTGTLTFDTVTDIGEGAFRGCTGITKLIFGENFKSAHNNAFRECTGISEVEFNAISANDLEFPIFSNNGDEHNFRLTIGSEVTKIPDYMFGNSAVSSISFASDSSCSSIGSYAFSHTYRLKSATVAIPDSVENIEESAFLLTKAKTIILGKGIKTIGNGAFCAMGIVGEEQHGFIEKIYFAADLTLVATEIETGEKEILIFAANSEENALNYAKIFYRTGYTYSLEA
ncbi:MAG: hypothetical protein E7617_01690 [Ruminococcaceae bacterium]|nr:hypothetical protein [Oscillospiraceae bacterium]